MSEESSTVELSKEGLKLSGKKTAELIAVFSLVVMALVAYVMWEHKGEAKAGQIAIEGSMNKIADSQRFFACIIAQPQDERMKQLENPNSLCNRISKQ